jgi:hypothetical protein
MVIMYITFAISVISLIIAAIAAAKTITDNE